MPIKYDDLISIIVPVYNVRDYLDECVLSIINQSHRNLEIILVDDGSTDGSEKKCDDWQNRDSRIIVIHKQNGGLSDSRNAALKIAKGQYIGFVDSDDLIDENMYTLMLDVCKSENAEIAVCGLRRMYLDGEEDFAPSEKIVYSRDDGLTELFSGKEFGDQACSKLYKAELFSGIEYPVGRLYEDIFTTYKVFLRANRIATVDQPLYIYRQRKGSITSSVYNKKKLDIIYSLQAVSEDPEIKANTKWQKALHLRKAEATCWCFIDMIFAEKQDAETIQIENNLFSNIYEDRANILRNTRYRSCRLLALFSFCGLAFTRFIFSSKQVSQLFMKHHQFFA